MGEDIKERLKRGLTSSPKYIPLWYAYDETGSKLHDSGSSEIPDYYMNWSTIDILRNNVQDITRLPYKPTLIEMGSGNCANSRLIIDELMKKQQNLVFYPVDISKEFLFKTAEELSREYNNALVVKPIAADYERGVQQLKQLKGSKLLLFFNSLQNMPYDDQVNTIRLFSTLMTDKCRLVFSADITQNRESVLKAYNDDAAGLGIGLKMDKGERIRLHEGVEGSCKYTMEQLQNIVEKAGLRVEETWTDEQKHAAICRCKIA
ncbi:uncharacterized protein LOC110453414 isoform X2 [Mizuhopecten yessoensis]|uniref:uncharacterized protein LOC110453414 isoform X2 n=1 Tax=Mizuhopecten yessoensis TaxID=6573 RepID=UPI000B45B108|nr:uncharacterized protein LOC110453414 isoform X2 [Mizuhopecten yessoensis]